MVQAWANLASASVAFNYIDRLVMIAVHPNHGPDCI